MDIEIVVAILFLGLLLLMLLGAVYAKRLFGSWAFPMRMLLAAIAGLQLIALAYVSLIIWALRPGCGVTEWARVPSPKGDKIAYIHDFNCGATTRSSMNISVLPKGTLPDGPGNVLDSEGMYPQAGADGEITLDDIVRVTWAGSDLIVSYNPKLKTFRRSRSVGDMRVRYLPWQPSEK
jgi:hypothetical protein